MSKLADAIKSAPLKRVEADCPEWAELAGETLYVREMTGTEREQWEAKLANGRKKGDKIDMGLMLKLRRELVASGLVTEAGERVFESCDDLEDLSGAVVSRVGEQAMQISGLVPDDVEELAGNSEVALSA